jgi:hypothetical protein
MQYGYHWAGNAIVIRGRTATPHGDLGCSVRFFWPEPCDGRRSTDRAVLFRFMKNVYTVFDYGSNGEYVQARIGFARLK